MNQLAGIGRCDYEPKPVSARGLRRCLRSWPMLSVCILTMAFLAHHPKARAQSVDGAVSPVLPPDAAELASRKPKRDWSAAATTLRIVLPPANEADQQAEPGSGQPLQIGFHRAIPSEFQGDLSSRMDWTALGDGSIVGAVSVTSPEARAVRAGIRAELGSGGEVRFFDSRTSTNDAVQGRGHQEFPVMTRADFREGGESETVWSPIVESDTIGIEVTLPSRDALSDFSFSIEKISHIYAPMQQLGHTPIRLECSNHVDVQCRSRSARDQQGAVGRIVFEVDGGTAMCSGTLLNDTRDDGYIPYFLTANHCVSTNTVARTIEARWFYQRASCGSERLDPRDETTQGGALVLATSVAQDSTLLRFRSSLPGGLYYSGWSADAVSHPTQVYGIHHPDGGVKKYSAGRTLRHQDARICEDSENDIGCITVKDAVIVDWSDGTVEPGSSGSGLFDDNRLIGVASGTGGTCAERNAYYGPFQHFFPRVRRWLSPDPYSVPFVTAASDRQRQGLVRIINHSERAGSVNIRAIDDTGERFGPVSLRLEAQAAVHLSSADLENGNAERGLPRGVGNGTGNWRLEFSTALPIEALAYIRTRDGVMASMHEVAAATDEGSNRYHVPFVNPGSNSSQQSLLRLINPGSGTANIVITGVDDMGDAAPLGEVSLTLRTRAARMVSARELERGGEGLSGRLGDGTGNWRLSVSGDRPLQVMSLLQHSTGHLTNLSRGRDGVTVGTPPPPDAPDLVVQSPSVSDSSLNPRQRFTLRATVRNSGTARSAATTLRYYRSTDATISTSDTSVGTDAVGGLSTSSASAESIGLTAPSSAGTYYYGACVSSVSGESNTGNNCSSGVRVTVQTPPTGQPDLVVQSPSVSDSSLNTGQSFTLRATVRNSGTARSAATTLRYYRSSNATISTSDTAVGTDAVSALSASATSAESISLRAPSSAGTYYYGACVNTVSGESNTRNNCSSAVRVTVQGSSGPAVTGTLSECKGTRTSFLAIDVSMSGTLQAHRRVSSVRVDGYANGYFIDSEFVGTMSSGQSRRFTLTGTFLDSSATRVDCEVRWSGTESRSQGGEVRGKSSMHSPLQVVD